MNIFKIMKKAITGGDWYIGIRRIGEQTFHVVDNLPSTWNADTLLFEDDGNHYLFVEQYNKKKDKGAIGYFTIENGIPVNKGTIIEKSYHMSYPFTFKFAGGGYI
jgi:hypothetical protein